LLQDLSYGFRVLYKNPASTAMAILSLSLGVAASTAVFSIFDALFLRSLPYPSAERLVYLHESVPSRNMSYAGISFPDLAAWRRENTTFSDLAAFRIDGFYLTGYGETVRLNVAGVTYNVARTLGIRPILGREIAPEEDRDGPPCCTPSGHRVALLTYGFWQRQFGGAPDVVGKTLQLDTLPYTVIGVLPKTAVFPVADLWVPLGHDLNSKAYVLDGIGRLNPGVRVEQGKAELARIHQNQAEVQPNNRTTRPVVTPLREYYLGSYRKVTQFLLGAASFVLLIACLNVMGLTMARSATRSREIAVRTALGAPRRRVMRQLLSESALLAGAAALVGVTLGWIALRAMLSLMPDVLPQWVDFRLDGRFVLFAVVVAVLTTLISGTAPALHASKADVWGFLAGAAPRSSLSGGGRRWLDVLVVAEIAIALVLLTTGALLVRAFHRVTSVEPGFRVDNVLTFWIDPPVLNAETRFRICQELLQRLRSTPGIESAGVTSTIPLGPGVLGHGDLKGAQFQVEGNVANAEEAVRGVGMRTVSPDYFRTLGIPLLAGRDFDERDATNTSVIMVNETFAKVYLAGADPVGKRVSYRPNQWLTVIGMVRDIRHDGLERPVSPEAFLPLSPKSFPYLTIAVRGRMETAALVSVAREAMRQTDPSIAIFDVHTMQDLLDRSLWLRRSYSWLFEVFAGIAVVMAVAGVYGVVSYAVAQRTREIGIRMALGAEPRQMMIQVLCQGLVLLTIGLALGVAASWHITRLMGSLLAGINPHDAWTYTGVIVILTLAAMAANLVPARRASLVDPLQALRAE